MSDADRRADAPGCVRHRRRNRGDAQILLAFAFGEALAMNSRELLAQQLQIADRARGGARKQRYEHRITAIRIHRRRQSLARRARMRRIAPPDVAAEACPSHAAVRAYKDELEKLQ